MQLEIIAQTDALTEFYDSRYTAMSFNKQLFDIASALKSIMPAVLSSSALIIFLCVVLLPFLQYLLSLGRGYETGVLRALGMSKARAWVRLFVENVMLVSFAFLLAAGVSLTVYNWKSKTYHTSIQIRAVWF